MGKKLDIAIIAIIDQRFVITSFYNYITNITYNSIEDNNMEDT